MLATRSEGIADEKGLELLQHLFYCADIDGNNNDDMMPYKQK